MADGNYGQEACSRWTDDGSGTSRGIYGLTGASDSQWIASGNPNNPNNVDCGNMHSVYCISTPKR